MSNPETLSAKQGALVGVAASVASGCRPCLRTWVQAARAQGACERGVRLAIETGLAVRAAATQEMADFAEALQGVPPVVDEAFKAERTGLIELFSCVAALCVHSTVGVERHIDSGRGYGVNTEQLSAAAAIGRAVHDATCRTVEDVLLRAKLSDKPTLAGNWCCESLSAAATAPSGGCACTGTTQTKPEPEPELGPEPGCACGCGRTS